MPEPPSGSRCRWLGMTPPLVFWRVLHECPPLDHFSQWYRAPQRPSEVAQCLKPLTTVGEVADANLLVNAGLLENAGSSLNTGPSDEWWAILPQGNKVFPGNQRTQDLGFSLHEATAPFGGREFVSAACGACPANRAANASGTRSPWHWAGCTHYWILGSFRDLERETQSWQQAPLPLPRPIWGREEPPMGCESLRASQQRRGPDSLGLGWTFSGSSPPTIEVSGTDHPTEPQAGSPWVHWWHPGRSHCRWAPGALRALTDLYSPVRPSSESTRESTRESESRNDERIGIETPAPLEPAATVEAPEATPWGFDRFLAVAGEAGRRGWSLETEFLPRGFSDGRHWWIGPHCGHCGAGQGDGQRHCDVCGRSGGIVPEQKRRAMGWAPFRPLSSMLAPHQVTELLAAATGQATANG